MDNIVENNLVVKQESFSIMNLILSADLTGKLVLFFLLVMSIYSWAIIIKKYFLFSRTKKKIAYFEEVFWSGQALENLYSNMKASSDNPLANIFIAAMGELKRKNISTLGDSALKVSLKDRVLQTMFIVKNKELEEIENSLGFLAVVGSVGPFIGLFGTVWGIMNSFQSIAASKNTSLAVVAPGIAEALFATAVGLAVAIPAVMFYNFLSNKVNHFNNKFDDFVQELNNLFSRAIDEGKI
ncbi:MAG: protein TolQ [Rickettsiaceae bacterium]|nr:protein TolQ [Rickettsiaceae bacterium]